MSALTFGGVGHFVSDPSNGDRVGLPLRSPAGYPLYYAIGADSNGKPIAVGTPSVCYGDSQFNTDAEVAQYIAATNITPEQAAANAAQWEAAMRAVAAQQAAAGHPPTGGIDVPIGSEP